MLISCYLPRFYDPESGSIKLGGKDIKEVNLRWLRERYRNLTYYHFIMRRMPYDYTKNQDN